MSYKVKSTIMSLVIGILLMAAYGLYAAGKVNSGAASMDDLKFWASSMLLFIGIGVAATIVMHIILSIVLSIGKAIRQTMGAQAVRELPRCQYEIVMKQVAMWDDYKTMKRIKNKGVVV